jgi:hypothetical protein
VAKAARRAENEVRLAATDFVTYIDVIGVFVCVATWAPTDKCAHYTCMYPQPTHTYSHDVVIVHVILL